MGPKTNEEYTSKFMELLIYVPYLKEEKAKVHISLEEAIQKLKNC